MPTRRSGTKLGSKNNEQQDENVERITASSSTKHTKTNHAESSKVTESIPTKVFPNSLDTPITRRASLFRSFVLADYITMLNAISGVSCIFFCLNYLANGQLDIYLVGAFICLPFALLFDIFDGWVARKRRSHSPWGSDLDSLSDCISFTLCPAAIGFTLGLRSMWDSIALCFFVFCGVARLARFNVTSSKLTANAKVPYYEGFPVPTSLILVALMYYLYHTGQVFESLPFGKFSFLTKDFHLFSIIFIIWGCFFVSSSVRIPKP